MKLKTLKEIEQLDSNNFNTFTDYRIEVVSIFLDLDTASILDNTASFLNEKYNIVKKVLSDSVTSYKNDIIIDGENFKLIPFHKLTVAEYIDLEYFQLNDEYKMYPILYRRFNEDKFNGVQFEEYSDFIDVRLPYFLELSFTDVIGAKQLYYKWKNNLIDSYKALFEQEGEEIEETVNSKMDKMIQAQKQRFSWESQIISLCDNDITKIDKILKMPIIYFFNILSGIKSMNM